MNIKETMNRDGVLFFEKKLTDDDIDFFYNDIARRLPENDDVVKFLFKKNKYYINLIESLWLNDIVDNLLNEKSILQDCYGLTNTRNQDTITRNKFHRDMAWFPNTRTSIMIFIPLIDLTVHNGTTEIVPFSHLFEEMPSEEYIETHKTPVLQNAGCPFVIDATIWHKTGVNLSGKIRPMILLKYSLAFFKQPVDLCTKYDLSETSEVIKVRMGWNLTELNWKTGNYTMKNTKIS